MSTQVREQKIFMSQAEIAQAHALYVQYMMPQDIARVLTDQRLVDYPSLPGITAIQINHHQKKGRWRIERKAFMERQSETIATALEAIKADASSEMVVIVKSLHNSFLRELEKIDTIREQATTARDILDCTKALETVQKRLFHFHALRSSPLAAQAIPVSSTRHGHSALEGGEADETAA